MESSRTSSFASMPKPFASREGSDTVPFDSHRLLALIGIGVVSLVIWIGVFLTVPPHKLLTYMAFFAPMWLFITSFAAAALYLRSGFQGRTTAETLGAAVRRSALLGGFIVANLGLSAAHKWQVGYFLVILAAAGAIEAAAQVKRNMTDSTGKGFRVA